MEPSDLRIDKLWLGPGIGNQVRVTHIPTGIAVTGEPVPPSDDPLWFEREKADLLERLNLALLERK